MNFWKIKRMVVLLLVMMCLSIPSSLLADDFKKDPVMVSLTDPVNDSGNLFAVNASVNSVEHRKVTFVVTNDSLRPITHELIVIKTDLAPGDLPLFLDGTTLRVDESQLEIVGRTPLLTADLRSATLTLKLKKGNYVLICNVGSHYGRGMYTSFRVGEDEDD